MELPPRPPPPPLTEAPQPDHPPFAAPPTQPSCSLIQPPRIYRGVSYDPATNTWRARIYCKGKHVTLGRYSTSIEAAFVHDRAAYFIHGDGAQTNHGLDAARRHNALEPPSSSWRVMGTLETLARESNHRRLAEHHKLFSAPLAACEFRNRARSPPGALGVQGTPLSGSTKASPCREMIQERHAHGAPLITTTNWAIRALIAIANRVA